MTGPDCAVMCNLINMHRYIHTYSTINSRVLFVVTVSSYDYWHLRFTSYSPFLRRKSMSADKMEIEPLSTPIML